MNSLRKENGNRTNIDIHKLFVHVYNDYTILQNMNLFETGDKLDTYAI